MLQFDGVERELDLGEHMLRRRNGEAWQVDAP